MHLQTLFAALHHFLRLQLHTAPLLDRVNVRFVAKQEFIESFEDFRKRVEDGRSRVKLLPIEEVLAPILSETKPWRHPTIAPHHICKNSNRSLMYPGEVDSSAYLEAPSCQGSLVPSAFLPSKFRPTSNLVRIYIEEEQLLESRFSSEGQMGLSPSFELRNLLPLLEMSAMVLRRRQGSDSGDERTLDQGTSIFRQERMLNLLPRNATRSSINALGQSAWISRGMRNHQLLVGGEGSGKTHNALLLAANLRFKRNIATVYIDCGKLQSATDLRMRNILDELTSAFEEVASSRPGVLILDNIDTLVPNLDGGNEDKKDSLNQRQTSPALICQVKLISDHIRFLILKSPDAVNVLATCGSQTSVASSLRSIPCFSSALDVPSLDAGLRTGMFRALLAEYVSTAGANASTAMHALPTFGKQTDGYTPFDLRTLAARVAHISHTRSLGRKEGSNISAHDLQDAIANYTPLSHQMLDVSKQATPVAWSDVGGLFSAKSVLTDVILHPVRYSMIYQRAPVSLPRGILLYGPPGCGKSYVVPALAKECNFNLVTCHGPELLDKYIGASEAKVRQLFARAYAAAPCILFLDDFDALAPRRGTDHTGVTDRVVNQLLTFLDGVESGNRGEGMVYIVGATSRPDKIDPALLRPGRLEKHIYIGYPDSSDEWSDLFAKSVACPAIDPCVLEELSQGEMWRRHGGDLQHLQFLSAADMKGVMHTAQLAAIHEVIGTANDDDSSPDRVRIEMRHLAEAVRTARPSLSDNDRAEFATLYRPFYNEDRGSSPAGSGPPLGGFNGGRGLAAGGSSSLPVPVLRTSLR